jgi:hypothetical protein
MEKKNTGKIRICVDFTNLNRATPKDEYPMPVADLLVDSVSGNKAINFLDGNAGYNQIFMAKEDDVDINTSDTFTHTHNQISGLITRARVCQLNNQVSSFLASYSSYLDNGNMCSILLLRNDGQERNGVAFTSATFGF